LAYQDTGVLSLPSPKNIREGPIMDPTKITFEYRHAIDYRPEFVNGIWGGFNTRGLIEMNFFTEHRDLPNKTTHSVSDDGRLEGAAETREPESDLFIRVFKQGIVVDLSTAESIYNWLGERIEILKKATSETIKTSEA
jgi:hypothetical protein